MKEKLQVYNEKMEKTIRILESDYASIRAGRANPAVLDKITVDYYGTPTPIQSLAAVSVSEARILVIQPWDKSTLKAIEKAIQVSDLGINPANDGMVIRIVFPDRWLRTESAHLRPCRPKSSRSWRLLQL